MTDFAPPEQPPERKKLTVWLVAGGVASLLLPLLAVVYQRVTETRAVPGLSGRNDLFERRVGKDTKLVPTPFSEGRPAPSGWSSLDFIKPTDELRARTGPPKAATATVAAQAPVPAPEPPPAAAKSKSKTPAKNAKKEFTMPKLQATKGFTSFTKGGKDAKTGPHGKQQTEGVLDPQAAGAGAAGGQDMSEILKKLPPGAENDPRVQEYLKAHSK